MAKLPEIELVFTGGEPDPGYRKVKLPTPLPEVGDDFDRRLGDFESYRDFMLSELKTRFPERQRWTDADMEQILIDGFAAALDQLSDMADRTVAESFLGTARDPDRVYKWLEFIGYDFNNPDKQATLDEWRQKPHLMEQARLQGPSQIHRQERMARTEDYGFWFEQHPLVLRAQSHLDWSGSWPTVWITVNLWQNHKLLDSCETYPEEKRARVEKFHRDNALGSELTWEADQTYLDILLYLVERYRMAAQEVCLRDVSFVGIDIALEAEVGRNYFQSEVRREIERVLGRGPGGFFEPERLGFGEDLHVSDFYQRLLDVDGVDTVGLTKFKRYGEMFPNRVTDGVIRLEQTELAVCDRNPLNPEKGWLEIQLSGGRKG